MFLKTMEHFFLDILETMHDLLLLIHLNKLLSPVVNNIYNATL
jgi:hypothetical protein